MDLNLLFFEETEESFRFLIQDHGCRSVRNVQPGWNDAQIIYQDGSTAVTISLEWSYPGLFVIFSRLVDGQLPEFPGHGKFHPIYLDALISLIGGYRVGADPRAGRARRPRRAGIHRPEALCVGPPQLRARLQTTGRPLDRL
jgi:hypothetical protein